MLTTFTLVRVGGDGVSATEWGSLTVCNGSCHDSRFSPAGWHFLIRRGAQNSDLALVASDSGKSDLKMKKNTLLSLQWVANKSGQPVAKVADRKVAQFSLFVFIFCFGIRIWASWRNNIVECWFFSCRQLTDFWHTFFPPLFADWEPQRPLSLFP